MNVDEALALLGIDRLTDAATARRAYLRLVKKHPPERDAEQFMRVRTAYEAVQPFLRAAIEPQAGEPLPAAAPHMGAMSTGSTHPVADQSAPAPAPSWTELFWNEKDPAVQESMVRAAVEREHSEEAYSLLLDCLAERASDAEQLRVAREAVQWGHGEFLLMIGQRWPAALSDAELHALREHAEDGPNWAPVACILIARNRAGSAAQLALSALARENRDAFAPRAGNWWLTRVVAGLLGSSEVTLALKVFEVVAGNAESASGGIEPVRLLLLRELASVRSDLPDDVAGILAKAIESGEMDGAELHLGEFADKTNKGASASLRRLLKQRAPTLSSYYDKSLQGLERTFREPWYRRKWGGSLWGLFFCANLMRLFYSHCGSDTASEPNVPSMTRQQRPPTPGVEKVLCEDRGPMCVAALRWARAAECGEMRAAFDELHLAYLQANKIATPSMRQQIAYSEAIKDTVARCPPPLPQESRP